CFLSFSRSSDQRHLHSFPTRRSSDLPLCGAGATQRRTSGSLTRPYIPRTERIQNLATATPARAAGGDETRDFRSTVCVGGAPARDRKSTRLNSSHDQISYAVFCLKKK